MTTPASRMSEPVRRTPLPWELVLSGLAAILVAVGLHPLLDAVDRLGRYLPPHDIAGDYLAAWVWAFLLGATILLWPLSLRARLVLLAGWAARVGVTLGFMLYYEWNYPTLDAYGYFAAALEPTIDWRSIGLGRGTENLNAFAWAHARLISDSYHAMKVTSALLGLAGTAIFYRAAVAASGRERNWLLVLLVFFPSLLFWSSIFGKDPIIFLGVATYAYGIVRWQREQRGRFALVALAGAGLATCIRLWFGPILLAPMFVLALLGLRGVVRRVGFTLLGGIALWWAIAQFRTQFALATISELLSVTNQWSQGWAEGGSAQLLQGEFTSVGGMVRFLPLGIFTALFRPLPGEVNNLFGLLAGMENALLLLLCGLALVRTRLRELSDPLVVWAVIWIVTWACFYAFVSFQNLGTAVRFKLQILPVLLLLTLHLARRRTVTSSASGITR